MDIYVASILVFFIGAAAGSFVNVMALRWQTGLSFIQGKSRCLFCNTEIGGHNLVPVFTFISLQGRCAHCKSRLPWSYLAVEIVSGVLALLCYFTFYSSSHSYFLIFNSFCIFELLVLIFIYDLRHKIIPDPFVFLFIFLSFLFSLLVSHYSLFVIIYSGLLVSLPFFLIWLFSGGRLLGFGDVKLMIGMGLLLGVSQGFAAVFISFWIGAAVVLLIFLCRILWRRGKHLTMKSEIPFGPFLCLGAFLEFFFQFKLW